jgi:hypothetical protein
MAQQGKTSQSTANVAYTTYIFLSDSLTPSREESLVKSFCCRLASAEQDLRLPQESNVSRVQMIPDILESANSNLPTASVVPHDNRHVMPTKRII